MFIRILTASAFPLGHIVTTPNAIETLDPAEISKALERHSQCDWGDLCQEDRETNALALEHGSRLFSAYGQGAKRFWIITEADRSVTTILLPQDY